MYFLDGALRRNSESHSSDAIHSKSFCQFRVFGSDAGLNLPPCLAELDLALNLKRIALRYSCQGTKNKAQDGAEKRCMLSGRLRNQFRAPSELCLESMVSAVNCACM